MPRDKHGNPIPDSEFPHTQLGHKKGRNGEYTQGREWNYDESGELVLKKDIDFTDHNRPQMHTSPHQHLYITNETGGTMKRSKQATPLKRD